MRAYLAGLVVLAFVLSGCSGTDTKGDVGGVDSFETQQFEDVELKVSATTGGIRGVVVDAAIAPIQGATVNLAAQKGNQSASSDKQGRFTFGDLQAGTYFLSVSHPLFHKTQTSVEVLAGIATPEITKIQLQPIFDKDPYTQQIKHKGFFQCSQAGIGLYSSSNCVTDYCPTVQDPQTCNGLPTKALSNITTQEREWHSDVGAGWQSQIFEMTWTPTSQGTSEKMGMVVSTYKPDREGTHSFANVNSGNPMRFQLDVGVVHATAANVAPTNISADGMINMSYFVSARPPDSAVCAVNCVPPGLAINQDFEVFLTQFYYGFAPPEWSFVAGNELPF